MATYDQHYRQEHLFGEPYPEFAAFITAWPHRGDALDLGCGQGRDALFLASVGFNVSAIDVSSVGIAQMHAEAAQRGLHINGIVADFYATGIERTYDFILLDSIFHFAKPDRDRELWLLAETASHLNPNGIIGIFIHTSARKEAIIRQFFRTTYPEWNVVADHTIAYTYEEKASGFTAPMQLTMYFIHHPPLPM